LLNSRGVDTTATALTYISFEIAKHPELFLTLAQELSKYPTVDSLKCSELEQLPYLNAVIRESLRLWPPAPTPFCRVTPSQGSSFGGHVIPPGVLTSCFKFDD